MSERSDATLARLESAVGSLAGSVDGLGVKVDGLLQDVRAEHDETRELRREISGMRTNFNDRFEVVEGQINDIRRDVGQTRARFPRSGNGSGSAAWCAVPRWAQVAIGVVLLGVLFRWVTVELDYNALERASGIASRVIPGAHAVPQ